MHNTRRSGKEKLSYVPELTKFEKSNRKQTKGKSKDKAQTIEPIKMADDMDNNRVSNDQADNRVLLDTSMPGLGGTQRSITRPSINSNNFKIKPSLIQMIQNTVQFFGMSKEDPNDHIAEFLELCDTIKMNGVTEDALRLRLFPFTLKDKAKIWLKTQPAGSFTTWDDLAKAFLAKYFPPSKTTKIMTETTEFQQFENESMSEAWERFINLQQICPHHGLPKDVIIKTFYNEVTPSTRDSIDSKVGCSLMRKTVDEATAILETMVFDSYLWPTGWAIAPKASGKFKVDSMTTLQAQISALSKQLGNLSHKANAAPTNFQGEQCHMMGNMAYINPVFYNKNPTIGIRA